MVAPIELQNYLLVELSVHGFLAIGACGGFVTVGGFGSVAEGAGVAHTGCPPDNDGWLIGHIFSIYS